jgi:hypothetical protein
MDKKDKKLEQVRALLAKAESTEFEGEAAVFRAKADELMANYAIEQWQLDAADESDANRKGREPERRDVNIAWYFAPQYRHIYTDMWMLFGNISRHCRCKVVWWGGYANKDNVDSQTVPVLGLPSDLDYFDLLFTHLQIQLFSKIHPGVQEGDSYIEALVRMKEAGMKWEAIGEKLIGAGLMDGPYTRNVGVRFTKEYTTYCEEQGRERKYINPKTYQRSFTEGFCAQVSHRLKEQKDEQKAKGGTGMELAVIDIKKKLDETANDMFGRPPRGRSLSQHTSHDPQGMAAGWAAGREANISGDPQRGVGGNRGELNA